MMMELVDAPEDEDFKEMYRQKLREVQTVCEGMEQLELPTLHDFSPGLYMRRIFMPAGSFVIGKTHKTEHFNIVLSGLAKVMIDGKIELIRAPHVFKSAAGVKKVLYIIEDMVWATTHVTDETDQDALEKLMVCSEAEEIELTRKELL